MQPVTDPTRGLFDPIRDALIDLWSVIYSALSFSIKPIDSIYV